MPVVTFLKVNRQKKIRDGTTILAAANRSGVPIGQSCGGLGSCGWCRVHVVEGRENLEPPSETEEGLMNEKKFAADERAACLARVAGDVSVTADYW